MSKVILAEIPSVGRLMKNFAEANEREKEQDRGTLSVQDYETKFPRRDGLWNRIKALFRALGHLGELIDQELYGDKWLLIECKSEVEAEKLVTVLDQNFRLKKVQYIRESSNSMRIKYRDGVLRVLLEEGAYFRIREEK